MGNRSRLACGHARQERRLTGRLARTAIVLDRLAIRGLDDRDLTKRQWIKFVVGKFEDVRCASRHAVAAAVALGGVDGDKELARAVLVTKVCLHGTSVYR